MSKHDIILYLCDRRACDNCSYPECRYTSDIRHAENFNVVVRDLKDGSILMEKENVYAGTQQRG